MPRARVVHVMLLLFVALGACRATHNITAILADHRDLAEFGRQLTATGLADDIDGRNTITVLAVDDAHMAQVRAPGVPGKALGHVVLLDVLVDYYDDAKVSAVITSPAAEAPSSATESKPNSTDASSKHGPPNAGAHAAPSPVGQGSSSDDGADEGKKSGDGGDGGKKNGASVGAAPRGLPFALAFLMAASAILVVNW
ncbi:hypothetical protein OsJ_08220 [Oryza sativa Japonica Group]|uniref:FAS1 domain-containing protein n=1 Tax=Oryza sativa subsp. japonica TaxID=39947 RepID=A3AAY1_ORYSJ|nr:hypothetical protein OsJ_08220 [Oryza sativa Japonica Group]